MQNIKNLIWILPFCCFILGYQLLNQLYKTEKVLTPNLIGLTVAEALKITSQLKLNLRIISEQTEQDLPEDTILTQKPTTQFVKTNQVIFVVIAKKPAPQNTPNLYGLKLPEVQAKLNSQDLQFKSYLLPSIAPQQTCFAQSPTAGHILNTNKLITYFSTGQSVDHKQLVIMPNFSGRNLTEIQNFCTSHNLALKMRRLEHNDLPQNYNQDDIVDQKPNAGTIVDLNKLTEVELYLA